MLYPPNLAGDDPNGRAVSMVNYANTALENSNSDVRFNIVGVEQIDTITSPKTDSTALYALASDTTAKTLRAQYGADLVSMLTTTGPYCGVAFISQGANDAIPTYGSTYGYSVVGTTCISSFAHEIGHNLSLAHSLKQGNTGGLYPWGRGHGVSNNFVTTMAYSSAYNGSQLQYFSNPSLSSCNGLPCGVDITATDGANAVQAMSVAAPYISLWSDLLDTSNRINNTSATQGTVTGKVDLTWELHASYQDYSVYRSDTLGLEGTKIAELTGATSYSDTSAVSNSIYFYSIKGVKSTGEIGVFGEQVLGYANVAPTSTSLTINTYSDRASDAIAPDVTDLNTTNYQHEDFTVTILTQPAQGLVAVKSANRGGAEIEGMPFSDSVIYTPPADGLFSGEVSFTYRITDRGGKTIDGIANTTVTSISAPEIAFLGTTSAGADMWANTGRRSVIGRIANKKSFEDLDISLSRDGITQTFGNVRQNSFRYISGYEAPLWQVDPVTVDARYPGSSTSAANLSFDVVSAPNKYVKAHLISSTSAVDTENLVVTLSAGILTADGVTYDPKTMGEWKGYLGEIQTNGSLVQLTDVVTLTNGKTDFPVDATGKNLLRLVGVIESISPVQGYLDSRESSRRYVRVTLHKPIPVSVKLPKSEGPEPLALSAKLVMERAYLPAYGSSNWETSTDLGVTWQDTGKIGLSFLYKFEAGDYLLRAKVTNKNSGAISYTEPVSIYAYEKLALKITGDTFSAPTVPVVLSGTLFSGETEVLPADVIYDWRVTMPNGDLVNYSTPSVSIDSTTAGRAKIMLYTRLASTKDVNYNWTYRPFNIIYKVPTAPRIGVIGPRRVEIGNQYTYNARVVPPWYGSSALNILSQWTLPDGTTVDGGMMDWSPSEDLMDDVALIKFEAWVEGYKATTLASYTYKSYVWDYIWSDFALTSRLDYQEAPARLQLEAVPLDSKFRTLMKEGSVQYEWTISDPKINATLSGGRANLLIDAGTTFTASVRVFDNRGNETILTKDFVVGDTPAYDITFTTYPGNKYWREPLPITVKANMANGHRKDRPTVYRWYLDDELVIGQESYYGRFTLLTPGVHSVRLELESKLGMYSSFSQDYEVLENQPPVCTLGKYVYSSAIDFRAKCTDSDGYTKLYEWFVNGEKIPLSGSRMLYPISGSGVLNIEFSAIDDAGAKTVVTETVPY